MLLTLPNEIVVYIAEYLDLSTLMACARVCARVHVMLRNKHLWRVLARRDFPLLYEDTEKSMMLYQQLYRTRMFLHVILSPFVGLASFEGESDYYLYPRGPFQLHRFYDRTLRVRADVMVRAFREVVVLSHNGRWPFFDKCQGAHIALQSIGEDYIDVLAHIICATAYDYKHNFILSSLPKLQGSGLMLLPRETIQVNQKVAEQFDDLLYPPFM